MRLRLILLVGATSSLVLVAFLVPLALLVRTAADDRAMTAAVVEAQALAPAVAGVDPPDLDLAVAQVNATGGHPITVFLGDGRVVGAPAPRSPAVLQGIAGRSATADQPGGREVVVAVDGRSDGTAVIRTFVSRAELRAGVTRAWLLLGLLGLSLLGVSLLVADRLARALTRPLSAVADVSHRLAHGGLTARAGPDGPPEVRAVSAGLNLLADRITELLAQERKAVADLSHRLRTPLTALRIDLESLTDGAGRARLLDDLDAVDRTVDAVIREAHRPIREGVAAACDAALVVADRVAFWSVLAEEERREFRVAIEPAPVPVRLSEDDLSACVDALIGNVFRHTAERVAFGVSVQAVPGGGARLVVSDDGAGLPMADPPGGPGSTGPDSAGPGSTGLGSTGLGPVGLGSTGLGLDIVRRTAIASGGGVRLGRSAAGGAAIAVDLGAPAVDPDRPATTDIRRHRARRRPGPRPARSGAASWPPSS